MNLVLYLLGVVLTFLALFGGLVLGRFVYIQMRRRRIRRAVDRAAEREWWGKP